MEVDNEIINLLARLGHHEIDDHGSEVFVADSKRFKSLKDIRRILSKDFEDDDDFSSRTLAHVKAIHQQFIPLLLASIEGEAHETILEELTKLFVLLTLPDSPCSELHVYQLRAAFVTYARLNVSPLVILMSNLEVVLAKDASKRTEDDRKKLELFLYLMRNLLVFEDSGTIREEFLTLLHQETVLDLIIHLTRHVERKNNREWNVILLDVVFNILRGTSPDILLTVNEASLNSSNDRENYKTRQNISPIEKSLMEIRSKRQMLRQKASGRHPNFGSSFQVGSNVTSKIESALTSISESAEDTKLASTLRRRKVVDQSVLQRSQLGLRVDMVGYSKEYFSTILGFVEAFLQSAYSSLATTLIEDIRREDVRLKLEDETKFIWIVRYFSRYARLSGDVTESAIMTTMDVWSFQHVTGRIVTCLETKSWAVLELSVATLTEMFRNMQSIGEIETKMSLRNAVFYDIRERLELVPRLLKIWESSVLSRDCLHDLAQVADLILDFLEDMAHEGAIAKATLKARLRDERKRESNIFKLIWNGEETYALSEGVKERGGGFDLNIMREILKDKALGPVFEEKKRTPHQLLARWIQIRSALQSGITLEQFVKEDLEKYNVQGDEGSDQEEEEGTSRITTSDKQVDFFASLRSFLSNNVYRNLTKLIDPNLHPNGETIIFEKETHALLLKFFRRLRAFKKGLKADESLEPILWHVENFEVWKRFLSLAIRVGIRKMAKVTLELANLLLSSIRRMARISKINPGVYVEFLFWRTKHENVLVSKIRKDPSKFESLSSSFQDFHEEELRELENDATSEEDEMESGVDGEDAQVLSVKPEKVNQSLKIKSEANIKSQISKRERAREKGGRKIYNSAKNSKEAVIINEANVTYHTRRALRNGIGSDFFVELVQAFEEASVGEDNFFISLTESVNKRDSNEVIKLLLSLGMRPPNRNVSERKRIRFSCELYWRLPINTSATELGRCARILRHAILDDTPDKIHDDDSPIDWCMASNAGKDRMSVDSSSEKSQTDGDDDIHEAVTTLATVQASEKRKVRRLIDDSSDSESEHDVKKKEIDEAEIVHSRANLESVSERPRPPIKKRIILDDEED